jgi:hypothetical protein
MIGHDLAVSPAGSPESGDTLNTDHDDRSYCRGCGSSAVTVTRCTSGPHHASIRCTECGAVTWAKAPWTLARARAFVLPWGKYRGWKLSDLIGTEDGLSYLHWLRANVEGNTSIAAGLLLDHVSPPCSDVSSMKKAADRPGSTAFEATTPLLP